MHLQGESALTVPPASADNGHLLETQLTLHDGLSCKLTQGSTAQQ